MKELLRALNIAELFVASGLAFMAVRRWLTRGGTARAWLAATFTILAVVVVAGELLPDDLDSPGDELLGKLLVTILVLFPFCLYRFATTFRRPARWVDTAAIVLTVAAAGTVHLLGRLPEPDEPRSGAFTAYVVLLLVQWVSLSGLVTVWLWRAGRGQPTVPRRRMRMLSLGAAGMALALVVAGLSPSGDDPNGAQLFVALLALATGPLFLLGFAPPRTVLASWRRGDERELREAESGLMAAMTPTEVADVLLPHVASILGTTGAVLANRDGEIVSEFGLGASRARELAARAVAGAGDGLSSTEVAPGSEGVLALRLDEGWMAVEASPYTPYFGREGIEILQSISLLTDVAMRRARLSVRERELAADLQQANTAMREFVAIASHDLRTPVAVVTGLATMMKSKWDAISDADKLDYLESISRQGQHLTRLVDDLLTVSKIDAAVLEPDPQPVPVDDVVRDTLRDLPEGAADVIVSAPAGLHVEADPEHVVRIVRNYIENARAYGRPPVHVEALESGLAVEIRVRDHGDGVSEDFRPRLFERFARAGGPAASGKRGTGLGLSIVRGLARAAGGDAWYEPNEPSGACFAVRLPRHNGAAR